MDKILITSFKDNIASAILNSQSTNKNLNFHADGYIDAEELPGVLEFFGETDVNKLLKQPQNSNDSSVFTNDGESEDSESEAPKEGDLSKFAELMNTDNAVLKKDGTAAYELQNNISSDLMTEFAGSPFAAQMQSLYEERKALLKKNSDTSAIEAKITALNEAAQEYIKLNQTNVTKKITNNDLVKTFKYGKDKEKTGYYVQTMSLKGNKTAGGSDESQSDSPESSESTEGDSQSNSNQTVGGVIYNIEVVTDQLHAIGHIDADSENSDIAAVAVYNPQLKNGGKLNLSGNFRQTIEKNNNQTNFGAAVDYTSTNFSTGAYASYKRGENNDEKTNTFSVEAYGKYKKSIRGALGYSKEDTGFSVTTAKYAAAKLSGKRELNNTNLTLTGSLEGILGVNELKMDNQTDILPYQIINAKGGLSFKSSHSDFSANILGSVSVERDKYAMSGYETEVTSTLLGNISNDKVDVTATLSAVNYPDYKYDEQSQEASQAGRKTNWSSSITLGLKKAFGKNVTPSITYNISNEEELKHNVAVNLGINF